MQSMQIRKKTSGFWKSKKNDIKKARCQIQLGKFVNRIYLHNIVFRVRLSPSVQ